jgi:hypothetical protein
MSTPTLPKTLPPERSVDLLVAPINLHLPTIYILIDSNHALRHGQVRLLALLEDLEDQVATNSRIIGITKVLVNAFLEGLDAFA